MDTAEQSGSGQNAPLGAEVKLFLILGIFFSMLGVAYGFLVQWLEPVGIACLFLSAGLGIMIAFYLWVVGRNLPDRPDDDPDGEIAAQAGDYGTFAPFSWWPLWLALAASLMFLGAAVGFWLLFLGAVFGIYALVGWVFEFFHGEYAH